MGVSANYRGKGRPNGRVIAHLSGIKISAVHHLVLSQSTRVSDRRTDRPTDKQNFDSNTVRCVTRSRTVKMEHATKTHVIVVTEKLNKRNRRLRVRDILRKRLEKRKIRIPAYVMSLPGKFRNCFS